MNQRHNHQEIVPKLSAAFRASHYWTAELIGRYCCSHCKEPAKAASARLARHVEAGELGTEVVDAYPTPIIEAPAFVGRPGLEPNYGALAYLAEKRWSQNATPQRIYWPTPEFAKRYGCYSPSESLKRPHVIGHDLLVSAVWNIHFVHAPEIALKHWRSEGQLQHEHRTKDPLPSIPDALVVMPRRTTAIEILGRYSADWIANHVRRFYRAKWRVAIW